MYIAKFPSWLAVWCYLIAFKCRLVCFNAYDKGKYSHAKHSYFICCDDLFFEFPAFLSNILVDCYFDGGRGYIFLSVALCQIFVQGVHAIILFLDLSVVLIPHLHLVKTLADVINGIHAIHHCGQVAVCTTTHRSMFIFNLELWVGLMLDNHPPLLVGSTKLLIPMCSWAKLCQYHLLSTYGDL